MPAVNQPQTLPEISNPPTSLAPRDPAATQSVMELIAEIDALGVRLRHQADLPHAEHAVLEIIGRFGPMTVPQIARQRCTSRQNVQIIVDRLEAEGRVELNGNPAHKRSALLRLTGEGKRWLEASQECREDLLLELGSYVSEVEIREATRVLGRVRNLLSKGQPAERAHPGSYSKAATKRVESLKMQAAEETESRSERESQAEEFPVNLL